MAKSKVSKATATGKASKAGAVAKPGRKAAPLANDPCCRGRYKLCRWAELVEAVAAFEKLLDKAADDDILSDVDQHNVDEALRNLKGDLGVAVPVQW